MNQFVDRPHYGYYADITPNQEKLETIENISAVYIILGIIALSCAGFIYWIYKREKAQNKRYTSISYV